MKKLEGRPFAMVGVNIFHHEPGALKALMEEEDLPWRSLEDEGEIRRRWNAPSTPTYYLIDHQGIIRRRWVGNPNPAALDAALEEWIREAEKETAGQEGAPRGGKDCAGARLHLK